MCWSEHSEHKHKAFYAKSVKASIKHSSYLSYSMEEKYTLVGQIVKE